MGNRPVLQSPLDKKTRMKQWFDSMSKITIYCTWMPINFADLKYRISVFPRLWFISTAWLCWSFVRSMMYTCNAVDCPYSRQTRSLGTDRWRCTSRDCSCIRIRQHQLQIREENQFADKSLNVSDVYQKINERENLHKWRINSFVESDTQNATVFVWLMSMMLTWVHDSEGAQKPQYEEEGSIHFHVIVY